MAEGDVMAEGDIMAEGGVMAEGGECNRTRKSYSYTEYFLLTPTVVNNLIKTRLDCRVHASEEDED